MKIFCICIPRYGCPLCARRRRVLTVANPHDPQAPRRLAPLIALGAVAPGAA
jgi:hypothetical protein